MPGLGPRVGGAHVDVNLNFDDKSLAVVGQRIHQQLSSIGNHNKSVYQSIGREGVTAWRSLLGTIVAGGPLIGSAVSAASGGLTMLAGSVAAVGQSTGALLPIFTSLGVAGATLNIGMRNFGAAVSEVDPKKLALLLKDMPKSMQAAVMSTRKLSNEMRAAVWPKLFDGLSSGINKLRETGVIQRGLGLMADQLNRLAKSVLDYANTKEGVSTLNKFFANNAKVFGALSKAVVPFLDGFLRLVNLLTPAALRLSGRITDIGERFQSWTKAEGAGKRIDDSMKKAEKTAGLLFKVLGNLGSAIGNIFGATNPATNTFLQLLVGVTQRFEDWTASVGGKNSIAEWAMNSVDVMKQFGKTMEAVFKVVAELADSRIIISFLKTVEGAFIHLGALPLDKMVGGFATLAEKLQPISSWLLAAIIAGAAFNIFLGSLMGQIGGLVSAFGRVTGIGDVFKGIGGSAGKSAGEVGKFTGILKGIGSVLGKAIKFAGLAGLAVWIVTLIAKSKMLQGKVKEVFEAFMGLWEPLKTAFSEISKSLEPVFKGLSPVFDILDKIATLGIGLILDTIKYAFESMGNVIKGLGKIISGAIDFFVALFTLDFGGMLDGLKKMASGVWPLLKGLFGLFVTFFAPAKLAGLAGRAFGGLLGGLSKAVPGILGGIRGLVDTILLHLMYLGPNLLRIGGNAIAALGRGIAKHGPGILAKIGRFVFGILKFFVTLPFRLMAFGARAIVWLGKAVLKNAPRVMAAAGRIVKGVIEWIAKLPGRLLFLGRMAILKMQGAIATHAPKVIEAAGRIFKGITGWFAKLPGRLFNLAKTGFQKLGEAIRGAVTKVKNAAGTVFSAIWKEVKVLPKTLLNLGKSMIGGLIDGIMGKIKDVKNAVGKIGSAIKGAFPGSPVKYGPLTDWNVGGGATGGGRNVIDAITGGLKNTDPIKRAMRDVASTVSSSLTPKVGATVAAGTPRAAERARPAENESSGAGNVYISKLMPHDYTEFKRQLTTETRLSSIGGRRTVKA